MKSVSDAYKRTMDMLIRPTTQFRGTLNMSDSTIPEESTVTYDTGRTSYSGGIFDSPHDGDYATLEQDFMKVGSALRIISSDPIRNGYVGSAIASVSGAFATAPEFTVEFAEAKRFSALSITFSFDYATSVLIRTYLEGVQVDSRTVHPHSVNFTDAYLYDYCDTVVMTFDDLSAGLHRLRIQSVTFGAVKTFTTADLISLQHTMEVDPISSALPVSELVIQFNNLDKSFDPDNPTSDWEYFENGQPMTIEYGIYINDESELEWVDGAKLFLSDTPVVDKATVTFKASDRLSFLTGMYYRGLYRPSGITLYDLAIDVLSDAGVSDYDVDMALQNVSVTAPLPVVAHRECLQLIANAGRAVLYCDTAGKIVLKCEDDYYVDVTSSAQTKFSDARYVLDGAEDVAYATLGQGAMQVGNSKLRIIGEPYRKVGYVSNVTTGAYGVFSGADPYVELHYTQPVNGKGISMVFGGASGVNPIEFGLRYTLNGEIVDDDAWEFPSPVESYVDDRTIGEYDAVRIIFYRMTSKGNPNGGTGLRAVLTEVGDKRTGDYYLDFGVAYDVPTVSKTELLKSVEMTVHNYSVATNSETIYEDSIDVNGTVTIYASYVASTNVSINVTGVTVVSHQEFAETAIITLSGNGTASITITGKPLTIKNTVLSKNVNGHGSECPVDNPLITSLTHASNVAEWMGSYLNHRNVYSLTFREDYRLEINDTIYVKSNFQDMIPARVTKLQYKLPYSRGGIEVRGLN